MCEPTVPIDECFPPLSAYARRVEEVRTELRLKKGINVDLVIMTSDERDPAWWESVRELGWKRIDHGKMGTVKTFNLW